MENSLSTTVAQRIREAHTEVAERWLEHAADALRAERAVHEHAASLILAVADYVSDPVDDSPAIEAIGNAAAQLAQAGRSAQGASIDLAECFDALTNVLFAFTAAAMDGASAPAAEGFSSAHRIAHAASIATHSALTREIAAAAERAGEREERLRRFGRLISHELKNRVGATLGASQLLQEEWLGDAERKRFAGMVTENTQAIQKVLENMSALAAVDGDRRRQRDVSLREIVPDVFRQLRDVARARDVDLRVAGDIPDVRVNAGAAELSLAAYLSNAIRFSDPSATKRWAEVSADVADEVDPVQIVVRVRDNGIGVPESSRERLFERFFRVEEEAGPDGAGLGLHLARETVQALGGKTWAEFGEGSGSTFAFALPLRREDDRQSGAVSGSDGAGARGAAHRQGAARVTASDSRP